MILWSQRKDLVYVWLEILALELMTDSDRWSILNWKKDSVMIQSVWSTIFTHKHYTHTHTHTHHFFTWASQMLLDFQSTFVRNLCILLGQIKTFHIYIDTIPPNPPRMMMSSIYSCCTISINFMFQNSKTSQANVLNHQADWLQSQLFSMHCINVNQQVHHIMLISTLFNFISCSTFISQLFVQYVRKLLMHLLYILPFSFNENSFPVHIVNTYRTFTCSSNPCNHCQMPNSLY